MSKVMVITDSTANIPTKILEETPIRVIPLQLIWGKQNFRDGVDISPKEFYQKLEKSEVLPTTSQVTPEAFKMLYQELLDQEYDILGIHISSKLSGTMDSAIQASREFPAAHIELVDSLTTSMAMGFQVMAAARIAAVGASLKECKEAAEKAKENSGVYFALNTLEYLQRGGRIGGAAAFLGHMLSLKPLLEIRNGQVESVDKVRTFSKTLERLLDLVSKKFEEASGPVRICAIHGNAPEEAARLLDAAMQRFDSTLITEALITDISPVIGTHTGPGALGLSYVMGV